MTTIWNATGVTPDATYRVPVDVSSSGAASRVTVQQLADLATLVGTTHNALGSINSATAIDLSAGPYVSATIAGALTFTFTNPPASPNGCEWTLVLTNGGSAIVTWPGSVTWAGSTAPTLTASGTDVLHFATGNGGTNWYGWVERDEQAFAASAITSGTIDTARLGSGTPSSTTFLRGDQTYASPTITGFTSAESTSSPNATVYVDSLTANGASTNVDAAFVPKGTGAFLTTVPDGTAAGGNKRGAYAVDLSTASRYQAAQVASGDYSVLTGGLHNKASGTKSGVHCGSRNTASGYVSNVCGGDSNTASNTHSFVGGGQGNTASGGQGTCAGGYVNTASGLRAFVGAGTFNTASGTDSWVAGGKNGTTRGLTAAMAHGMVQRAAVGDRQRMGMPLACAARTDATPTVLTSDADAAGAANQLVIPNNSSHIFEAFVVAHDATNTKSAGWIITGVIRRGANAASTTIVGTNTTTAVSSDFAGAPTTAPTATADTTNGALCITYTGLAATTTYPVAFARLVTAA